ncbi:MAG TPA: OB-fold domain-containing protein [Dehalococcoidia bacterium]|nr:OB-fold domain-containing protein [Dehalococcoidia bacterium]
MTSISKPLPNLEYAFHAPFWEGTRLGELRVQRCLGCGRHRSPPHPACPDCLSLETEWVAVEPRGTLFTWNISNQAMHPAFKDETPFAIVIVALSAAPGVRFLGRLVGADYQDLRADQPMEAVFEPVTDEVTLVNWRPAAAPA